MIKIKIECAQLPAQGILQGGGLSVPDGTGRQGALSHIPK